jgi:hypothetical protein
VVSEPLGSPLAQELARGNQVRPCRLELLDVHAIVEEVVVDPIERREDAVQGIERQLGIGARGGGFVRDDARCVQGLRDHSCAISRPGGENRVHSALGHAPRT